MKLLQLITLVLIALVLTACPLENERPPERVAAIDLPELPESIIQIPLVLKSRYLKRAFYQQFPNPLLTGETAEFKMKLSGKEKKEEDKGLIDRVTTPIFKWVDKTFYVSSQLLYEVDLYSYNFWFEKDKFFCDIIMDLRTKVKLKNEVSFLSENIKLNGSLNCPMQVRMVLDGTIKLTKEAAIKVVINEEDAKIKFQKICSSEAIKSLDMPKILRPVLEPLKKRISKSVNTMIAKQLQSMLDNNSESLSFKEKVASASKELSQPYEMVEGYWLVPQVHEVFVSPMNGTGKGFKNQLELSIGVKAKPIVLVTTEKPQVAIPDEITFSIENYNSKTHIYVNAKVPLSYAAKELQTFLKEYIQTYYSKYGYTIGETKIYPGGKRVVVEIDILRSKSLKKKATIYLWGVPKYDQNTQEIYLDDLAFTAKSKNILLKFAQWIMNPKIMKQLTENTRFGLSEDLKELQQKLNDFTLEEEMGTLSGTFNYVDISEVFVSKTDFEVYLQAEGDLNFKIN